MKRYLPLLFLLFTVTAHAQTTGPATTLAPTTTAVKDTTTHDWQLIAQEPFPGAATVALAGAGAGSVTNGTHRVKVVFTTAAGHSQAGTQSAIVTVVDNTVNGKVAISAIPTGSTFVTGRKVYFSLAGGTVFHLLSNGTIANNTATTLTANDSDATLAAAAVLPNSNTTANRLIGYDGDAGTLTISGSTGGTVTSVSGTANQIAVATGTTTPVVSLPSAVTMPGSLTVTTTSVHTGVTTQSVGATTSAATDLLINPTTKASGNLIDAQVNSVSKFSVRNDGLLGLVNGIGLSFGSGVATVYSNADGVVVLGNAAYNGFTSLKLGGTTSSFPALGRSTTVLSARLADGTAGGTLDATGSLSNTGITTDATHTDSSVCQDSTTHVFYFGSGAAGICLGTSGARFKNSIKDLNDGLTQVLALRPRTFRYNKGFGDNGDHLQYGFIAEEMVKPLPNLVRPDAEGKPQSVDYMALVPVLVKSIQQLEARVRTLEAELAKKKP